MRVALFWGLACAFASLGCRTEGGGEPSADSLVVAEPPRPTPPAAIPPPPVIPPAPNAPAPVEQTWYEAASTCEGREACLAAAARVPKDEPPDIAAIVRAKANGAEGRCFYEATMAVLNDDALSICEDDARHALTPADARLIRGAMHRVALAWRRYEESLKAGRR